MPRKKPEDLEAEDKTFENEAKKPDAVVVSTEDTTKRKVKLDLEVDTSVKDMGPNPYAKIIHMARAVDSWRIFPRIFISTYIFLLYKVVIWYMALEAPSMEQSGLVSIVVGAGAAWFGLYTGCLLYTSPSPRD